VKAPSKKKKAVERLIEVPWIRGTGFAGGPDAHYDASMGPAKITFRYFTFDEMDRSDAKPDVDRWTSTWKGAGATEVVLDPVVDPARAPRPEAPPAPAAAKPAALGPANHFGLQEKIASQFGQAILQFLGAEPMLASLAIATIEKKTGQLTAGMKAAVLPMLNHLAAEQKIQRRAAGTDWIFYLPEQEPTLDAWHARKRRT
jgi:hypothetical protein